MYEQKTLTTYCVIKDPGCFQAHISNVLVARKVPLFP
jgi:hypothetical protein